MGDRTRHYRLAVADAMEVLSEAELATPSWCGGWQVRDVLGHLVHLAEATAATLARDIVLGGGVPNRVLAHKARTFGRRPVAELCSRLRTAASGGFRIPGVPAIAAVGDVMVHGNDALRPVGREFPVRVDDVQPLLDLYRRSARMFFKRSAPKNVTLVAEDLAWSAGEGPEVHGRAVDLLLLLANRRQVVDRLSGPGVASLERP